MIRRILCATLVAGALLSTSTQTAHATDGHFLHGVGAINSAMGGAGVAAPASLLGTFYLNPAGLMAFDGTRVEFGFELFKADRTVASTFTPASMSGSTTSKSEFVPIPAMAFSVKLNNEKVVVGLGGLSIGTDPLLQMNTFYYADRDDRSAFPVDSFFDVITEDIPARVAADTAYQNAQKNSDKQNARIEHDKALARVMTAVLQDDTELFKQFMDNESFKRWLTDTVFGLTYDQPAA